MRQLVCIVIYTIIFIRYTSLYAQEIDICSQYKDFCINNQVQWEQQNNKGNTLLYYSIQNNQQDLFNLILEKHPNIIDIANNIGDTPLILSTHSESFQNFFIALFNAKANMNVQNNKGNTPFIESLLYRSFFISKIILTDKKFNPSLANKDGLKAVHLLAYMGEERMFYSLIKHPLFLKIDINIQDKDGITALHYAAGNGHSRIVQVLLENGAKTNILDGIGNPAIFNAVIMHHSNIVDIFKKYGASIYITGQFNRNILHESIIYGEVSLVRQLVKEPKLINQKDIYGNTPLSLAQERLDDDMIKEVLKYSDIMITNKRLQTPLMQIIELGKKTLYNSYFKLVHNYNMLDIERNNLLHYCAKYNVSLFVLDKKIIKLVDFFAKNKAKKTPFDLAIENSNLFMVEFYLKNFLPEIKKNYSLNKLIKTARKSSKYSIANSIAKYI